MSKVIEHQLEQLGRVGQYHFVVPKKQEIKLSEDCCYLIKLNNISLHPNPRSA